MATATTNPVIESEEGAKAPDVAKEEPSTDKDDGEPGIGAKVKAFMESKTGIIIMAIISMILAIVSIVGVNEAYDELNNSVNDLESVVANWESRPVVDIQSVPSSASCPPNFDPLPSLQWPGANSLGCACPSDQSGRPSDISPQSSSLGRCDGNQTKAFCEKGPGVRPVPVPLVVGGNILCVRRGGVAAADRKFDVTADKGCDGGQQRCGGSGTWDTTRVTCQPRGTKCPILRMNYGPYSGSGTDDIIPLGSGQALFLHRNLSTAVPEGATSPMGPLVNFEVAYDGRQCFGDSEPAGYASKGSPSQRNGVYHGTPLSGETCDRTDPRYTSLLGVNEHDLLDSVFSNSTQCNAANRGSFGMPADFRGCGQGSTASAILCRSIAQTTICNKLKEYVPPATTSNEISAIRRPEIFWAATCELSRKDVITNLNPIADARDKQNVLRILNIIFNVFSGFIIPILLVYNAVYGDVPCVPYEGQAEKNLIKFVKIWISAGSKLGKLIPLIIIQSLLNGIRGFLQEAQGLGCSDSTTSGSLTGVTETLDSAYSKNFITVATDTLGMLYSLFQIYKELTDGTPLIEK